MQETICYLILAIEIYALNDFFLYHVSVIYVQMLQSR